MKVVILAGGHGTRLSEETATRPKPMVELGGRPLLWHIMSIYGAQGFREFVIACGYRQELIKEWFLNFHALNSDFTVDLATGRVEVAPGDRPDWRVHLVDTGQHTQTGGRVRRLRRLLDSTFMLTYGDGVGDVDLNALLAFHRSHGRLVTVTAVRPPARFGAMRVDDGVVSRFQEKPQTGEGWINGGFMVVEPGAIDYVEGDETPWELAPMERLAAEGQLMAWKHEGFWLPMDTLREKRQLEALWERGDAPWKIW